MDFMNLAEVPEVDSVKDGDTVFVVRDGEVCRVAKDKVGGGAGGYLVDVSAEELVIEDDVFLIATPVPGLIEAAASGAAVSVAIDIGLIAEEDIELGTKAYMPTTGVIDAGVLGEEFAGMILAGVICGQFLTVVFTNGQLAPITANLTALRSKLGGGKSVQL